jgi:hypothetical protein
MAETRRRFDEDAGIKLASVASQTLSTSGRAMIEALIAGERDRWCWRPGPQADAGEIPELRRGR